MRKTLFSLPFALLAYAQAHSQALTPDITSWYLNTTNYTGYNGIEADCQQVEYSTNYVYVSSSGIPAYTIGPWANPNVAADMDWVWKIDRTPTENTGTKTTVGQGQIAVTVNGVPLFHPGDGMSYNNGNVWFRVANHFEAVSFDATAGHPAPSSDYHYHVSPIPLNANSSSAHSPIVGYAFDGFPIYGSFGYSDPMNASSSIQRIRSSYQTRNISDRTTLPDGTVLAPGQYGPAISGQYTLGAFIEDYEYVSGHGDLDEYNGRLCVTPEYPSGTYAYFITTDDNHDPEYPFILGSEYYGVVTNGNTGPTGGHNNITEPTTIWNGVVATADPSTAPTWRAYPNPASDFVQIDLGPDATATELCLLNSVGQVLQTTTVNASGLRMDVSELPAGMYILQGKTANTRFSERILVH